MMQGKIKKEKTMKSLFTHISKIFCSNINKVDNISQNNPHISQVDIDYLKSIFEDKLRLYAYCEQQLNRLAFVNSIFIAAIAVLIDNNIIKLNVFTLIVFLPFLVSLTFTLWSTLPKFITHGINRGEVDHRSVYGISKFCNIHDYKKYVSDITPQITFDEIVAQIYRINSTIVRDYMTIRIAVLCDFLGLVLFLKLLCITIWGSC